MADILIIDDDANLGRGLRMSLRQAGHACRLASTASAGWEELLREQPDLVLLDLQLPDMSGIDLLPRIRERKLDMPVIIMTAFGTVTTAVSAMKEGAADYIEKPLSVQDMCRLVMRLLKSRELAGRIDGRQLTLATGDAEIELIAASPAMKQVTAQAEKIAILPARPGIGLVTTLILGETGTGKEMIARHIHRRGPGPQGPFVHVNCTAIPENLLETEYFGHERGVFTDAKAEKHGLFEAAHGGTLFLDEVGDIPLSMQAKLLVAIETGRFRRVGATREQSVDARIIAATNSDLEAQSAAGRFRADLYHRLKMFRLTVPPLRERPEDLWALTESFLGRFARQLQRPMPELSADAKEAMLAHPWPGNVRELAHVLLQALAMREDEVLTAAHLGLGAAAPIATPTGGSEAIDVDFSTGAVSLADVEKKLLQAALAHAGGNISEAARLVGMPRGSFRYRLEKLGLM
jgi:DNA-binding NtrC family response regulator